MKSSINCLKNKARLLFLLAVLLTMSAAVAQPIVGDFSTFPGSAGQGWTNGWTVVKAPAGASFSTSNAVIGNSNADPLNGGSDYYGTYSQSVESTASLQAAAALYRDYGSYGDVNVNLSHSVIFSLRIDSDFANLGTGSSLSLFGYSAGGASSTPFATSNTWYVSALNGKWAFFNGTKNGSGTGNGWVDSGITITQGQVYDFAINIDPVTKTWTASVNEFTTPGILGFQGTGTIGKHIEFASTLKPGGELDFSLGDLIVVPEPGSIALVGAGLIVVLACGMRKRYLQS